MSKYPKLKMSPENNLLVLFEGKDSGRVVWSASGYNVGHFAADWDENHFHDFDPEQPPELVKRRHKNKIEAIAVAMIGSFAFEETEEGGEYWGKVCEALLRIANEGR